jgi:hypothetical protein
MRGVAVPAICLETKALNYTAVGMVPRHSLFQLPRTNADGARSDPPAACCQQRRAPCPTPSTTGCWTRWRAKLPAVAEHLDYARADVLAFTAFPREIGGRFGPTTHYRLTGPGVTPWAVAA